MDSKSYLDQLNDASKHAFERLNEKLKRDGYLCANDFIRALRENCEKKGIVCPFRETIDGEYKGWVL